MRIRYSSVNFGGSNGGLTTVGFTLYDYDGTEKAARSTTGVVEIGTDTGCYATSFGVDEGWDGYVLWDTGSADPTYAQDEKFSQLNSIQEATDSIRIIRNTMKNHIDFESEVLLRMAGMEKNITETVLTSEKYEPYAQKIESMIKAIDFEGKLKQAENSLANGLQSLKVESKADGRAIRQDIGKLSAETTKAFRARKDREFQVFKVSMDDAFKKLDSNTQQALSALQGIMNKKMGEVDNGTLQTVANIQSYLTTMGQRIMDILAKIESASASMTKNMSEIELANLYSNLSNLSSHINTQIGQQNRSNMAPYLLLKRSRKNG